MLYNMVQCPHRVTMDLYGDPALKDPISPFVQLLWERGNAYEQEVIEGLKISFTNLRPYSEDERERLTLEAMKRGDALIYGGRISFDDLLGDPDLLRRQGSGYVAGDIKSGSGVEGETEEREGKPKKHYAVQLALYTDILERRRLSNNRTPFIWDVHGEEVIYDLNVLHGKKNPVSLWSMYQDALAQAREMVAMKCGTLPALMGICKLCQWRAACTKEAENSDDLTLIPELGRSRRDSLMSHMRTVRELASADLRSLCRGDKTVIPGIGAETLAKFQARAQLQQTPGAKPYLKEPINLPRAELELFFDIETDPMRDICYLHGFIERRNSKKEKYVYFLAGNPTPEKEKRAFAEAWAYIKSCRPCTIYYYSPYEKTCWRKLCEKYPDVVTEAEIEELFGSAETLDLYQDIVRSKMVWPTRDHSIKTLATHLGFKWRDTDPSGASSVEWYNRWVESGDASIRQRILEYNEDDCIAMRVLLDLIRRLSA